MNAGSARVEPWGERPYEEVRRCIWEGIGFGPAEDERQRFESLLHRPWSVVTVEDGRIVGMVGAYRFDLSVPGGGAVGAVGTTVVVVSPTHRRRGHLRTMLDAHLAAARADGAVVSGLWASETPIYGRFGYGEAARRGEWRIEAKRCGPRDPHAPGQVTLVPLDEAVPDLKAVYARHARDRAGMLSRTDAWWSFRRLYESPALRGDFSPYSVAVYRDRGRVDGYLLFRRKSHWVGDLPKDEILVAELIGTDAARRALWTFVLSIDLVEWVSSFSLPVDDVVPFLIEDTRRATLFAPDSLWVRLLDVPAALGARRYEVDGELVFRVRPVSLGIEHVDFGTFKLSGGPSHATCAVTDAAPTVELDLADLGALAFGGASIARLAAAGRVRGDAGAIARADAMFRTRLAPWCPERF